MKGDIMRIFAKVSYESLYVVWNVISKIADIIYVVVCAIDKWLMENEK